MSDITVDYMIEEIRKIMKKYIASTDKIAEIQNFIAIIEEELEDETGNDV